MSWKQNLRPRSVVLLLVTAVVAIFAALNWQNLLSTAPIHLLFWQTEAPLGLLLLLVVSALTLLFLGFVAFLEAQARSERKRLMQEIEHWRQLAEDAEASRLQKLEEKLEAGFDDLYDRIQTIAGSAGSGPKLPDRSMPSGRPGLPAGEGSTETPPRQLTASSTEDDPSGDQSAQEVD